MKKFRPRLVNLDDRIVPTVITWTNPVTGGFWGDAANWSPQQVPGENDEADFTADGTPCTIGGDVTLGTLKIPSGTTQVISAGGGRQVTVKAADISSGQIYVGFGATVKIQSGVISDCSFDNSNGGALDFGSGGGIGPVTLSGTIQFKSTFDFLTGSFYFNNTTLQGVGASDKIRFLSAGAVAHASGTVNFTGLDGEVSLVGSGTQFWVDVDSTLNVSGSGIDVGVSSAFIADIGAVVNVNGLIPETSWSILVHDTGSDFNLLLNSVVTTNGIVAFDGTGHIGDSGLLVKGTATLDTAGVYLSSSKIEFQGTGYHTLYVVGGLSLLGGNGDVFRGDYATGACDQIVADEVSVSSNDGISCYLVGDSRTLDFLFIRATNAPNYFQGEFGNHQSPGRQTSTDPGGFTYSWQYYYNGILFRTVQNPQNEEDGGGH